MERRPYLALVLLCFAATVLVCALWITPVRAGDNVGLCSTAYPCPFGSSPWAPSQAKATFSGFIDPKQVPTAQYCAGCHREAHRQWRESAHANAFRTPWYRKNVQLLIDSKGIEATRHCEGCHNPTALFSGALQKNSKVDRSFDEDGVTCMSCHAIAAIQNTSGTGSYVMGVPAAIINEDGTPVIGPVPYQDILDRPDLHRRAVMKDFYRQPEFCSACHKAAVPKELNGYKWFRAFSVYDEWQQSSWSKQSPLTYYSKPAVKVCQTCHMPAVDSHGDYGGTEGKMASHRWLGANTAIPQEYAYSEQMAQVKDFLKQALKVDIFALHLGADPNAATIAPIDRQSFTVRPAESMTVDVLVQNVGIGHSLVPEQRDFYEAWVEFKVTDATGRKIYHSGYLDEDGYLDPRAHSFTNRLISRAGKVLERHEVWESHIKGYDNTVMPGKTGVVRYNFRVPLDARGPLTITAAVNYRRFRRGFTDWVYAKPTEFEVVKMASATLDLKLGANLPAKQLSKDDSLRWNNYGIALTDEQQFSLAANAFQRALELDPGYVDGYTNIGITYALSGQWIEAYKWFDKTLALSPNNLRAQAFKGLTYRAEYRLDKAIATLEPVARAFPRDRRIQQELAFAYLLTGNAGDAKTHYEMVQSIDPDDLLSSRYLSSAYAKLGMKEEAAREAALYATRVDDPAAIYLQQEFWRSDQSVPRELVPFHVHSDDRRFDVYAQKRLLQPSITWPGEDLPPKFRAGQTYR